MGGVCRAGWGAGNSDEGEVRLRQRVAGAQDSLAAVRACQTLASAHGLEEVVLEAAVEEARQKLSKLEARPMLQHTVQQLEVGALGG